MTTKARSPDFLRRINPQPFRLGYAETPAGWRDLPRFDYRTWFMCVEPGATLWVQAAGSQRVRLPGGHGYFLRPGTWVTRWTEPDRSVRRYWITFDWDEKHPVDLQASQMYAPARPDPARRRPAPDWVPDTLWERPVPLPEDFYEMFLRLNERHWQGTAAGRATARGLLLEVLLKVLAPWCEWPVEAAPDRRPPEDVALELLREAAARPFAKTPAVEVLLARAGQSHDHVSRRFRETYGMTPLSYLNRLRMERAKALLDGTDLSVTEVARRLGFGDFRYFSRLFRKVTGRTPREHRHRAAKRSEGK